MAVQLGISHAAIVETAGAWVNLLPTEIPEGPKFVAMPGPMILARPPPDGPMLVAGDTGQFRQVRSDTRVAGSDPASVGIDHNEARVEVCRSRR